MGTRELHTCDRCGREVEGRNDLELLRVVLYKDASQASGGPMTSFPQVDLCRACSRQVERAIRGQIARRDEQAEVTAC